MTQKEIEEIIVPILSGMKFFTAENDATGVYVQYKNAYSQVRVSSVDDGEFLAYVYDSFCERADVLIPPPLEGYIKYFERYAIAHRKESSVEINRRITGGLRSKVGYFLADDDWKTVIVRPSGWQVGVSKRVQFLRTPSDLPQCVPVGGGNLLKLLRPYINLDDQNYLLFVINLVQSFSKTSAHFAIILSSDKGTGKSTLTKLFRALVDPSKADVNPVSKSDDELKIMLANNYLLCIDNVNRGLSENQSNILCSAVTGAVEARRKLYTTSEQVLLSLRNIVVVNGIHAVPRKSDLAQRSLLFELQEIQNTSRRGDADFWDSFNADKPRILGSIFDTLVLAMKILPTLSFSKRHRMADAYEEMVAIAEALGISQTKFDSLLDNNNNRMQALRADDPFVDAVKAYMQDKKEVHDSVSTVYAAIRENMVGSKACFPLSPSTFSRRMNDERESLWAAGLEFVITDGVNANQITIVNKNLRRKKSK